MLNQKLGRKEKDVFKYLEDKIGTYFAYPGRLKKEDPRLYEAIDRLPEERKYVLAI